MSSKNEFHLNNTILYSIFLRNMGQIIKANKWAFVISQMYRVLKPGGYIEIFEPGNGIHLYGIFNSFKRKIGKPIALELT
jgi:hypothetical protein